MAFTHAARQDSSAEKRSRPSDSAPAKRRWRPPFPPGLDDEARILNARKIEALDRAWPSRAATAGDTGTEPSRSAVLDSAIKNYLFALKFQNKNEKSDNEWCEFQIGWVYCVGKNDYQKGLQYLQKGWDVKEKGDWGRPYMVGHIFLSIGDYEKSNKYYQKSLEIDESPLCIAYYSISLVFQSRSEEALNFLDTICKEPQSKVICNQRRFYIHLIRKEFDLAEQFYTDFLNAGGTPDVNDSIWLSYLYKKTGKEQAAITLLKRCKSSLENQTVKNSNFELYLKLSSIYAILENKEEALKNLTKSVDIGLQWGWQDFLEICPLFENLRNDPDFKATVHRAQNEIASIRSQVKKMEQSGETDL